MLEGKDPVKDIKRAVTNYKFALLTARLTSKLIDIEQQLETLRAIKKKPSE